MVNIVIRRITLDDIVPLQEIARQTFYETFSETNTEENMSKYLEDGFATQKLIEELNNEHSEFYFAISDQNVIAYLKLNFGNSQTELQDDPSLEIERIYVLKEYHGKKIGQLLYEKAMQVAEEKNASYIWLGVWEENPRAIRFYQKNGFEAFDKHIFKLGDDDQVDIMMKKKL
jgi:ribosomal protein S18 acetylase RimI-like enzyme